MLWTERSRAIPTPTARLGLLKPTTADNFVTQDLADNWQKVDDNPGVFVCTKATRPRAAAESGSGPVWGTGQAGRIIAETDTGLMWRWSTANTRERLAPSGILKRANGDWARGLRTSDFSTMSTTARVVVSITNVVVPEGRRPLMVVASFADARSNDGDFRGFVMRSNSANTGPTLDNFVVAASTKNAGGVSRVTWEPNGLPAGEYSWSFQIARTTASTAAEILATAASPTEITIIEL